MDTPGPIVLVGGGGFGPWVWKRAIPFFQQRKLSVVTPQLRATGGDKTPPASVTLDDWVDDLFADLINLEDATLVAHSFAGYVAAGALSRITRPLRSVIIVDAALPQPGKSWFEVMGSQTEGLMRSIARDGATPWFTRDQLDQVYPNNGFTQEDLVWVYKHVTSLPIETFTQPVIDKPIEALASGVRLHYLRCLQTHPPVASITSEMPDWILTTMDSAHWPMVTAPSELSRYIIGVVENA